VYEKPTVDIETIRQFCPEFRFHPNEKSFPCSIEYLLNDSVLYDREKPEFSIVNPTQRDLYEHWKGKERNYVDINSSQNSGGDDQQLYYWVKSVGNHDVLEFEITYILLYAWQDGQVLDVDSTRANTVVGAESGGAIGWILGPFGALLGAAVGSAAGAAGGALTADFSAIVSNYGEHQGDLERVTVRIRSSLNGYRASRVTYEQHGNLHSFDVNDVELVGKTHPVAAVGLGQHPTYNPLAHGGPGEHHLVVEDIWAAHMVDVISDAGWRWKPWADGSPMIEVGIDGEEPVNDQIWAKFEGRFGVPASPSLKSATYIDGTNLSGADWSTLTILCKQGELAQAIPSENGPNGLNGRSFRTE
jgi:hypothetical protein